MLGMQAKEYTTLSEYTTSSYNTVVTGQEQNKQRVYHKY